MAATKTLKAYNRASKRLLFPPSDEGRLWEAGARRGYGDFLEQLEQQQVEALLAKKNAYEAIDTIEGVDDALTALQSMERELEPENFAKQFVKERLLVSGCDREGRPIVWMKTARGVRNMWEDSFKEIFLARAWIIMWAMACRPPSVDGIVLVVDDSDRPAADYNPRFALVGDELMKDLFGVSMPIAKVYLYDPDWKQQRAFAALPVDMSPSVIPVRSKRKVLKIPRDPSSAPRRFRATRPPVFSRQEELRKDQVGCIQKVFDGKGFSSMSLYNACFPSLRKEPWCHDLESIAIMGNSLLWKQTTDQSRDCH
mmetsp:Transcript_36302/g.88675  ORF Transcript_36302/g.88675 Transcript_36302/m.88675 type:complete len:312 (+) Transcript_36302:148-1083(+)